jgi:hypothetical protein
MCIYISLVYNWCNNYLCVPYRASYRHRRLERAATSLLIFSGPARHSAPTAPALARHDMPRLPHSSGPAINLDTHTLTHLTHTHTLIMWYNISYVLTHTLIIHLFPLSSFFQIDVSLPPSPKSPSSPHRPLSLRRHLSAISPASKYKYI